MLALHDSVMIQAKGEGLSIITQQSWGAEVQQADSFLYIHQHLL